MPPSAKCSHQTQTCSSKAFTEESSPKIVPQMFSQDHYSNCHKEQSSSKALTKESSAKIVPPKSSQDQYSKSCKDQCSSKAFTEKSLAKKNRFDTAFDVMGPAYLKPRFQHQKRKSTMTTEVKKKGQEEVVNVGSTPITIYFKAARLKLLQFITLW